MINLVSGLYFFCVSVSFIRVIIYNMGDTNSISECFPYLFSFVHQCSSHVYLSGTSGSWLVINMCELHVTCYESGNVVKLFKYVVA